MWQVALRYGTESKYDDNLNYNKTFKPTCLYFNANTKPLFCQANFCRFLIIFMIFCRFLSAGQAVPGPSLADLGELKLGFLLGLSRLSG
jgi:hypothetical protein